MSEIRLSHELQDLLQTEGDSLTVAKLADHLGDRGFGLTLVILSLPSALPVPAAGYSVPFGLLLVIIALQMLIGKTRPVFPTRLERLSLSRGLADRLLKSTSRIFERLEWAIRPRLRWVGQRTGLTLMGGLVMIMALLMMIPIPMTNTFPALVIFLIGVGLTEADGLFAIGACIVGVLAVLLYAALVWAIIVYGPEVINTVKDAIRSVLS